MYIMRLCVAVTTRESAVGEFAEGVCLCVCVCNVKRILAHQ